MDQVYEFVQGPLFRFAMLILVLGLARRLTLVVWDTIQAVRQAGDKNIPYRRILLNTLGWFFPFTQPRHARSLASIASFAFHIGLIITLFFLGDHIAVLEKQLGFRWFALPRPVMDLLTLLTIVTGLVLLIYRLKVRRLRVLSGGMDYALVVMLLMIGITGFVASRPWNPIPYRVTMLIHMVNGIGILVLMPFTKLAHCALFPLLRFCSEIGWHFPARGGTQVVRTLTGAESRKV